MQKAGTITFRRHKERVTMTITTHNIARGTGHKPGFVVKSVHFGTKLRGDDVTKGEGYGWDGKDHVTARKIPSGWRMTIPIRDNDSKNRKRRFIKGNVYIRTPHREIIYFDPRFWIYDPKNAFHPDGFGGHIMELDLEEIPSE